MEQTEQIIDLLLCDINTAPIATDCTLIKTSHSLIEPKFYKAKSKID